MSHPTENLIHRTPSVGSTIKKLMEINPELQAREMMTIIQQSMRAQGEQAGDFANAQIIDENRAIQLAKAALRK